jgi:dephospho-CoA kinase
LGLTVAPSLRIGLTGGIGSGKSTVASMLVDCGATCVDTDAISRSLTAVGGAALAALAEAFGADVINAEGALDRDRMRSLVFRDATQRQRLEAILHPMISEEAARQALAAGDRPVVFDVPLLSATSHWRRQVARVLVVDCLESTQVERVMRRNAWPAETVHSIMAQQLSRTQRRRLADAVIVNDHLSLDELKHHVQALWRLWSKP